MGPTEALSVRALSLDDIGTYVRVTAAVDAESGVDGAGHAHPYSRFEPQDLDEARAREVARWSTAIDEVGWRRAWGLFDGRQLVGSLYLAGADLRSGLHRVDMGMGIARSHHRRGGGTMLLTTAITWAHAQPTIDWIDLGVFTDNPGAQALYARHGFEVIGRMPDRFRVDGVSIDDVTMTLDVAGG